MRNWDSFHSQTESEMAANITSQTRPGFGAVLQGKVAVVTGASSGIGIGIAEELAKSGASVCLAARREDQLQDVKKQIEDGGGKVMCVKTDVTVRQQMKDLIKKTEEAFGPVDILVNNAGIGFITYMKNGHEDAWEKMVDVNCKGVLNGIGAVLPGMMSRRRGHIINMSSNAGRVAFPLLAVYTGSKFFVEGVSRSLRMEVKDHGIKVTCIQAGDVISDFGGVSFDQEAMAAYGDVDQSRCMDPGDIGRAIVYAVTQPEGVGVNEILIEPTKAPYV